MKIDHIEKQECKTNNTCQMFFTVIMRWQQFGNGKSESQNNICNRDKITAKKDTEYKQIYLGISLDLSS